MWPVAMAWKTTYASLPRTSPTIRYWGLCLSAAVSRSNMLIDPLRAPLLPPNPSLVSPGIQFSWGRFSSLVSSMLTIFICGGMNSSMALRVVVFPDAVPPQTSMDEPNSTEIHK